MSRQGDGALAERFALEYLKDLNATQAYLRARPGVKLTTAATNGWRLLRNAEVQDRIQALAQAQADRLRIDADRVLRELAICGYSDVRDYVQDDSGALGLSDQAHPLATRAVRSVKHKTTTTQFGEGQRVERTTELTLWDKPGSLRTLAQHLKLIGQDSEGGGGDLGTLTVRWVKE